MGRNRAHKDTKEIIFDALNGPPISAIIFLNIAIGNFFNNELSLTAENKQTSLLFIGIHAGILTISEALWGMQGINGFKLFLETFIDTPYVKFSIVAEEIHKWRNILAHQFVSLRGHNIDYDYNMVSGFLKKNNELIINPEVYLQNYLNVFADNKLIEYFKTLDKRHQEEIQQRILSKYLNN